MAAAKRTSKRKRSQGGGKVLPALLHVFGVVLIVAVIVFCLPMTAPRLFGYEPFEIVTGSMEPEIPVGSAVYAKTGEDLTQISEGDIIAFYEGGTVTVHRVVTNRTTLGEFVTKGDANNAEDLQPVLYDNVIGPAVAHYPYLGRAMAIFSSTAGKVYLALIVACGVMLILLAGRVRSSRAKRAHDIQEALAEMGIDDSVGAGAAGAGASAGGAHGADGAYGAGASPKALPPESKSNRLRQAIVTVLVILFLGSGAFIGYTLWQYAQADSLYNQAADRFTTDNKGVDVPISVDFDKLRAENPDIVGWIYCEDTPIDYPVLKGRDNDQYLRHDYTHEYNIDGSIFVDADNRDGFVDPNTIIYGHHMNSGSMFACTENWADQEFYEAHPVIWLLTPEKNYRIVLFSGHHTQATSDMYDIIHEPGEKLAKFLSDALEQSDFDASTKLGEIKLSQNAKYVMLTTCGDLFEGDRYVLHGQLVPVE